MTNTPVKLKKAEREMLRHAAALEAIGKPNVVAFATDSRKTKANAAHLAAAEHLVELGLAEKVGILKRIVATRAGLKIGAKELEGIVVH
jgi:hypothetical protein